MANFGKSFSDAFEKADAVASAGTLDLIKEKIKANAEIAQSNSLIDLYATKSTEGKAPEDAKPVLKQFEQMKKMNLKPEQVTTVLKALHPELVQDETARAIKENTRALGETRVEEAKNRLALTSLPKGVTVPKKDVTPEERSAFLDQLPSALVEKAQSIADYDQDITKIASMRSGERSTIWTVAKVINPSLDEKKYVAQQNYIKDMAKTQRGTVGGQINSANTLIEHLDFLNNQVDKMKNTNLKPANAIINFARDIGGDPTITDYEQAVAVVNSEIENLLTGVGATQEGLRFRDQLLSKNASYSQMKSAIQSLGHIMQARTHSLEKQYEGLFGKPARDTILHSESKQILNNIYGNTSKSTKIIKGVVHEKAEDGLWYPQSGV